MAASSASSKVVKAISAVKALRTPRGAESKDGPALPYVACVLPRHNGSELLNRCIAARPWWRQMTEEELADVAARTAGKKGSEDADGLDDDEEEEEDPGLKKGAKAKRPKDSKQVDFHFYWGYKPFDWDGFYSRPPGACKQLINRIRGNGGITIKDRLAVNMRKYHKAARLDAGAPPHLPVSFVITVAPAAKEKHDDDEWTLQQLNPKSDNGLKADYELRALREAAAAAAKQRGETMWIVKPPPLNRGRGIHVFKTLKAVESFLKQRRPNSHWVVQKYIEDPLLLDGRKFDIRLLVLVTPDQKVWMYRDSYVRTASGTYDPSNKSDAYVADQSIHLVNDAVQIKFESYGKYEDANKLSLAAFDKMLQARAHAPLQAPSPLAFFPRLAAVSPWPPLSPFGLTVSN